MAVGHSGTPLARKLGIKEGALVATVDVPDELLGFVEDLADGVESREGIDGDAAIVLLFATERADLERHLPGAAAAISACCPVSGCDRRPGSRMANRSARSQGRAAGQTGAANHAAADGHVDPRPPGHSWRRIQGSSVRATTKTCSTAIVTSRTELPPTAYNSPSVPWRSSQSPRPTCRTPTSPCCPALDSAPGLPMRCGISPATPTPTRPCSGRQLRH